MDTTILILVIALLAVYLVVRQFTEQVVTWRTLLLLPAVAAYACYSELQEDFTHFAPALLIVGLLVGILPGLLTGIFRGKHTRVRLDSANGRVLSKPELASSLTWLGLLILHIGVIAAGYLGLNHSIAGGVLTAFVGSFLLVNIIAQKYMVYTQYSRYQNSLPQQFIEQRNRY